MTDETLFFRLFLFVNAGLYCVCVLLCECCFSSRIIYVLYFFFACWATLCIRVSFVDFTVLFDLCMFRAC